MLTDGVQLCLFNRCSCACAQSQVECAVVQAQHKSSVWSTGTYLVLQFICQLEPRCMPVDIWFISFNCHSNPCQATQVSMTGSCAAMALLQIAVKDVIMRRGTLLLTPENTVVLGGQASTSLIKPLVLYSSLPSLMCMFWLQVDDLEAARQKALKRWHQPACEPSATVSESMLRLMTAVFWSHMTCKCTNTCTGHTVLAIAPKSYQLV